MKKLGVKSYGGFGWEKYLQLDSDIQREPLLAYGSVETVDHVRGLKYVQEFKQNLDIIEKPKITKCTKTKPYTKITFKPDYQRLGITGLTPELLSLLKKRIYDVAAITDKNI